LVSFSEELVGNWPYLVAAVGAVPTANICTVTWLFGLVLYIVLSFLFVQQEYAVYVLYALSLDCFGIKLTEIGRSDPAPYLVAAVGAVPTANICTVTWLY
jgi:hypothetical protein